MGSSSSKRKNPVMNQATTDPDNPPAYKKLKDRSYPAKFKALAATHHTDLKPGHYQESPQAVYEGNLCIHELIRTKSRKLRNETIFDRALAG